MKTMRQDRIEREGVDKVKDRQIVIHRDGE